MPIYFLFCSVSFLNVPHVIVLKNPQILELRGLLNVPKVQLKVNSEV